MDGPNFLHVEICQNINSTLSSEEIEKLVEAEIYSYEDFIPLDIILDGKKLLNHILNDHVDSIICSYSYGKRGQMKVPVHADVKFHVYRLTTESAATETMENDGEDLPVSSHWILPVKEFHYLWESLYFDSNIKDDLLHFIETAMIFADHNVDTNIISWNKVVLLHGPPGTGKTSLCKALAQKIIIRTGKRFSHGEFVEINSHSLFSKWFSESGKLVMKLFNEIKRLLENPNALVCILIDEIESLAHARKSCNGTEPTDAIRVVNALLTQLDQIKRYSNVLILTTSNLSEAIDLAFIDRADIKQYIGPPKEQAIYQIYTSCLKELMRAKLIEHEEIHDLSHLKKLGYDETLTTKNSLKLKELSEESVGLSGRILRKIPFLAHAFYLRTKKCTLARFLRAMHLAVRREKEGNVEEVSQALHQLEY